MAGMTLDQLRVFLSCSRASALYQSGGTLYIPQTAVSAAIQNLEEEYGVKLFHRID